VQSLCLFIFFFILFFLILITILRKKDGGFLRLSTDHKPSLPDEVERIVANGGIICLGRVNGLSFYPFAFLFINSVILLFIVLNILAVLAVSRSFGDNLMKHLVISEPFLVIFYYCCIMFI
jgi:serine/threonine protein phosphatase PrpC